MPAPEGGLRRDVLLDFADAVNALDGSYITAEDVGTSARDMVDVAEGTRFVTGLPAVHGGSGDPSPFTALGVEAAIRACAAERFGSRDLDGCRIAVVGCGRVGEQLARRLAAAGAQLLISDIDEGKRSLLRELPGAEWASPEEALLAEVDVLAPCALGGAIADDVVGALRAAIVCGAANNQLADDRLADRLAARRILYAPDFIANAGGLMNVGDELDPGGYDEARVYQRVTGIEAVMARILHTARRRAITPLAAAVELARERLDASGDRSKISPTEPHAETPPRQDTDRAEIPPVLRGDTTDGDPAGTPRIAARGIRRGRA
jgi:leucine dehydrogenase